MTPILLSQKAKQELATIPHAQYAKIIVRLLQLRHQPEQGTPLQLPTTPMTYTINEQHTTILYQHHKQQKTICINAIIT